MKNYEDLEFKEWDKDTPLALYNDDVYFFDTDQIYDHIESNGLKPEDLKLVWCTPCFLHEVDEDYWEEILPEDWTIKDVSKEVNQKLIELNQAIKKCGVASWYPSNVRTSFLK